MLSYRNEIQVKPWLNKVSTKYHVKIKCQYQQIQMYWVICLFHYFCVMKKNLKIEHYFAETKALSLMCFNTTGTLFINVAINLGQMNDKNLYNILCQMPRLIPGNILCFCEAMTLNTKGRLRGENILGYNFLQFLPLVPFSTLIVRFFKNNNLWTFLSH